MKILPTKKPSRAGKANCAIDIETNFLGGEKREKLRFRDDDARASLACRLGKSARKPAPILRTYLIHRRTYARRNAYVPLQLDR